jgi:Flp pilus assembly protein TadG
MRFNKARRGSTMIEFALIATMFFGLLIGIADFGQFLFVQQALMTRVTAAARWGAATDPANSAGIRNVVLYGQSTASDQTAPSFGLTAAMVNVATADAGTANYRLVVGVSGYSCQLLSSYIGGNFRGPPISVSVPLTSFQ